MSVLQIKKLSKSYDNQEILHEIDLTVNENDRIGVVGLNGAGKSTLFKIIIGEIEKDSGEIIQKSNTQIGILQQEPTLPENKTIQDTVEEAIVKFKQAHLELEQINEKLSTNNNQALLERQSEIHSFLDAHDGWQMERKIKEILSRLQLFDTSLVVNTLSTGLKKRVALAKSLIQNPDFLLLDEPTNHLDTESIDWLEKWILQFKGACLFVTHDRYFLDRLATRIIEVDKTKLFQHNGNYSSYLESKIIREEQDKNRASKLDKLIKVEIEFARQGVKARRTKPKYRETKAKELNEQRDKLQFQKELQLQFEASSSSNNVLLEIETLSAGYTKPLFQNLSLQIYPATITGIIGRNGTGKSTLLKVIEGVITPFSGEVKKSKGLKIGIFSQNFENLDVGISLIKNVGQGRDYFERGTQKYRIDQLLEDLLFLPKEFGKKIKDFSGGEKARASLACLIARGANLLLFDEPTNNLDLPTLQALEALLLSFDGAALVVTHDRYFLDKIADTLVYFEEDSAFLYKGNYSSFLEYKQEHEKHTLEKTIKTTTDKPKNKSSKMSNQERKEFEKIENGIEIIEKEISVLENTLQDASTYQNPEKAKQLNIYLKEKQTQLTNLLQKWELLAEKL